MAYTAVCISLACTFVMGLVILLALLVIRMMASRVRSGQDVSELSVILPPLLLFFVQSIFDCWHHGVLLHYTGPGLSHFCTKIKLISVLRFSLEVPLITTGGGWPSPSLASFLKLRIYKIYTKCDLAAACVMVNSSWAEECIKTLWSKEADLDWWVLEDGPGPSSSKWRTKLSFTQSLPPPSAILAKVQQVHHKDPHHVEGTLGDRWGLDTSFSFLFI